MTTKQQLLKRYFNVFDNLGIAYRNLRLNGRNYLVTYEKNGNEQWVFADVSHVRLDIQLVPSDLDKLVDFCVGESDINPMRVRA